MSTGKSYQEPYLNLNFRMCHIASGPISVYHGTKSGIMIRLPNAPASHHFHTKWKSVIILEISPIIRVKCFSLRDNMSCFIDLAVVSYYELLRLGSGYDRIDAVFDRYFDQSLKKATRISRGTGTRFKITELSEIPKNFESFSYISQNKNDLNEYLAEKFITMHHENQILVCTYRETILSSHQDEIENNTEVSITACQSEEADQRLICPHCIVYPPVFHMRKLSYTPLTWT